jgi:lipopolysaccharide export system protein LptA
MPTRERNKILAAALVFIVSAGGVTVSAWGQEPPPKPESLRDRIVINADSQEISNLGKPEEKWAMQGNANLVIPYEGKILNCTGEEIVVYMSKEIIYATGGVVISDGTMTIWCHRMDYEMKDRNARFRGKPGEAFGVVWAQKTAGDGDLNWARTQWADVVFDELGMNNMKTGRVEMIVTPPEKGADRAFLGFGKKEEAPSVEEQP